MNRDRRSRRFRGSSSSHSYSSRGSGDRRERGSRGARDSRENSSRRDHSEGGSSRSRRDEAKQRKIFRPTYVLPKEQISADEEAIRLYKDSNHYVCERCDMPIGDVGSALVSKTTGKPIHFDCAIASISEQERVENNERIIYIGQGRFGILKFPNMHDMRHFSIRKVIDWEDAKDEKPEWRNTLADLYSQVR